MTRDGRGSSWRLRVGIAGALLASVVMLACNPPEPDPAPQRTKQGGGGTTSSGDTAGSTQRQTGSGADRTPTAPEVSAPGGQNPLPEPLPTTLPPNPAPPAPPPAPPAPPPPKDRLMAGERLGADGKIVSANGVATAVYQLDGNFVVYAGGRALFSTATHGRAVGEVVMQDDGNFVLYSEGTPLFHSSTHGNPGAYVVMQNDCNLVVYSSGNAALWASNTYPCP